MQEINMPGPIVINEDLLLHKLWDKLQLSTIGNNLLESSISLKQLTELEGDRVNLYVPIRGVTLKNTALLIPEQNLHNVITVLTLGPNPKWLMFLQSNTNPAFVRAWRIPINTFDRIRPLDPILDQAEYHIVITEPLKILLHKYTDIVQREINEYNHRRRTMFNSGHNSTQDIADIWEQLHKTAATNHPVPGQSFKVNKNYIDDILKTLSKELKLNP